MRARKVVNHVCRVYIQHIGHFMALPWSLWEYFKSPGRGSLRRRAECVTVEERLRLVLSPRKLIVTRVSGRCRESIGR